MDLQQSADNHLPALEADEVRFNVQIALLSAALRDPQHGLAYWTLGAPGHCAIQTPGRPLLLGDLDRAECHRLAESVFECPGVLGANDTAHGLPSVQRSWERGS